MRDFCKDELTEYEAYGKTTVQTWRERVTMPHTDAKNTVIVQVSYEW